jgi:membrane-associated phospholipid phosphatase
MTKPRSSLFLLWFLAFANCVAVVLVFVIWLDRPVADRVNAMMRQTPLFDWTARVLGSLYVVLAMAGLMLLWRGVQYLRRRPPAAWALLPLCCSWSVAGALSAVMALKFLIGRSQVYPPWIERREYGFFPLHGVHGYGAFPSATMAVAAAMLAVIWIQVPRRRALSGLLFVLVAGAIIMTNGHWVSDVIGGGFLGAFSGWLTVRRSSPPGPTVGPP